MQSARPPFGHHCWRPTTARMCSRGSASPASLGSHARAARRLTSIHPQSPASPEPANPAAAGCTSVRGGATPARVPATQPGAARMRASHRLLEGVVAATAGPRHQPHRQSARGRPVYESQPRRARSTCRTRRRALAAEAATATGSRTIPAHHRLHPAWPGGTSPLMKMAWVARPRSARRGSRPATSARTAAPDRVPGDDRVAAHRPHGRGGPAPGRSWRCPGGRPRRRSTERPSCPFGPGSRQPRRGRAASSAGAHRGWRSTAAGPRAQAQAQARSTARRTTPPHDGPRRGCRSPA